MQSKSNYRLTIKASFIGYIVQAIINNFLPLLFVTFQTSYHIPLSKVTLLVTLNFAFQLTIDFLSIRFIDRIGYRASMLTAHICATVGLVSLSILPELLPDPFVGILISVMIYAVGGGLVEVLVSPIVEACPTDNKEAAMSLLHAFYCWGHVAVVLISTLFFRLFGIENWRILARIWALVPLANTVLFAVVPIAPMHPEGEHGLTVRELIRMKSFWLLILMMLCAGASEQSVSQWASAFAEQGLHISKVAGDLAGPMMFAVMMGTSRAIYGKFGARMNLDKFMSFSSALCAVSYLLIIFSPWPVLGLVGCALTGFSVGILWPGTFSKASASIRNGGTAMFAFLALAGDLGCGGGPTFTGMIAGAFGDDLRIGILAAIIFPITMLFLSRIMRNRRKPDNSST